MRPKWSGSIWTEARRVPILDAARKLGISLSSKRMQRCPFPVHEDSTPSFSFSPSKNLFNCFGCGQAGSVIEFTAGIMQCTPKEAAAWLVGANLSGHQPIGRPRPEPPAKQPYAINPYVYAAALELCPLTTRGTEYLAARGITANTAAQFQVGYVDSSSHLQKQLLEKFGSGRLEPSGLLQDSGKLVFHSDSLLFPYIEEGQIRYLQGRHLGVTHNRWTGLRGIPKWIYNLDAIEGASSVYICEGVTDVLSAYELQLTAIGMPGATTRLTSDVARRLRGRTVYIVTDQDTAGHGMANRLIRDLRHHGVQAVIQNVPAPDLNDYLCRRRGLL